MELILDGVKLMVIGMLTVFVFLLIMIFCMNLMAKILAPLPQNSRSRRKNLPPHAMTTTRSAPPLPPPHSMPIQNNIK